MQHQMKFLIERVNYKMKLKLFISILCTFILCNSICIAASDTADNTKSTHSYLSQPTGQYQVGFRDFHWINQNTCPDFNYNGKNSSDFSIANKKYCHEILARIYYPSASKNRLGSPYYPPYIKSEQESFKKIPSVSQDNIRKLSRLRSFSIENDEIIKGKKFPVLLFSPGLGFSAQMYENIITELVSHGYIVIGIGTPFINLVELPNNHIIKTVEIKSPASREQEQKLVDLSSQDFIYVFEKIHSLHNSNLLFSMMDLSHIGLFGHSIGARAEEDIVKSHSNWFQALAALDGDSQASQEKISIPFLDIMSAKVMGDNRVSNSSLRLENDNYLVVLSPSDHDTEYSYHLNFSDLSTLQYLPVYQAYIQYLKKHKQNMDNKIFTIKLLSHEPTEIERNDLIKSTFVLVKKGSNWSVTIYENKEKKGHPSVSMIPGLSSALKNLPDKLPEELSETDIVHVKNILLPLFNKQPSVRFLGTGNGWEIMSSINTYLLQFFNMYLINNKNPALNECTTLSTNTYLKCGVSKG